MSPSEPGLGAVTIVTTERGQFEDRATAVAGSVAGRSVPDGEAVGTVNDIPSIAFTTVASERIEGRRDWVATMIAAALLLFFAFSYFGPMVIWAVTGRAPPEALTASLEKAAAAVGSLLGTIVGFYFSEKRLRR